MVAIFVSFWVWQAVRLIFPELEIHPIFMYMYSVVEIRDTSEKTVDLGKQRINSTLTALAVGLPALAIRTWLMPHLPQIWMQTAVDLSIILIGSLLTLLIAERTGCGTFCGLAAAVFVVLAISQGNGDPFLYALLRALQTVLGVWIAWWINVQLWPYPKKK